MKTLISANLNQYKANMHCHSNLSDGKLSPKELKEAYKSHGYSVLAITDHERCEDHTKLNDEDFLMLTGYEMYVRPSRFCIYDPYEPEIHMNLYPKDPHKTGLFRFSQMTSKYIPIYERFNVKRVGKCDMPRRYSVGYINRVIEDAVENGYIVAYNHPVWSLEDYDTILGYRGFFSMEMCNYGSFVSNRLEYNGALYDAMLRRGTRIGVHSGDDNHNKRSFADPKCDSFGAFTYILSEKLDHESIYSALENGSFYSSMGPQIYEVTVNGNTAHIRTSPCDVLIMHDGSKRPGTVYAEKGSKITEASFHISGKASYIRFSALDDGYKFADTRGFFRDEYTE